MLGIEDVSCLKQPSAHSKFRVNPPEPIAPDGGRRNKQGTVWGDLEAFGRNFCAFLEQAVDQRRLRNLAANKQAEHLEAR